MSLVLLFAVKLNASLVSADSVSGSDSTGTLSAFLANDQALAGAEATALATAVSAADTAASADVAALATAVSAADTAASADVAALAAAVLAADTAGSTDGASIAAGLSATDTAGSTDGAGSLTAAITDTEDVSAIERAWQFLARTWHRMSAGSSGTSGGVDAASSARSKIENG